MARRVLSGWGRVGASATALLWLAGVAHGVTLDEKGEISLGVRAYTAARIGSENTDIVICNQEGGKTICGGSNGGAAPPAPQQFKSFTFPVSPAGHLRQSRYYVEAELDHNLMRLLREGFGPFALLNDLPFKFKKFKYHLVYRGEYDGVYDYGPAEYRTAYQYYNKILVPEFSGNTADIGQARQRLRNVASNRQRLFQAYLEAQVGELLMRFGRQILSWGETDAFRLLDNINPLDASFGGFLVPLDERRVPLDMLRLNYFFGDIGPIRESYIEAYAAIDDAVGYEPGVPQGSPWALPNLGAPSATVLTQRTHPERVFKDTRGGFQIKFNVDMPGIEETTFGFANYWTYFDTPAVQTFTAPNFPIGIPPQNNLALAIQSAPLVQVTGGTATFALPSKWSRAMMLSGQPIFRTELAYFHGEPRFSQGQLDPFVYAAGPSAQGTNCGSKGAIAANGLCTGNVTCAEFAVDPSTHKRTCVRRVATGPRTGDSWNFVLGIDTNQFIRWLNPGQSFFMSTQFFYKHLNAAQKREKLDRQPVGTFNGEVLPVPQYYTRSRFLAPSAGAAQAVFIHNPIGQYLQTLLIATSYYSGQISPSLTLFYDWSGSFVALPQITFSRDPFRFSMSYSYLVASKLKGASGVSLLRDRDNVLFQIEYVI
jgi:hypothetical protein